MRRALLLTLLALAVAAGCSGNGGGYDDDDDDAATTPTATPTPVDVAFCYVIWGSTSAGGVVTEYYVDFPAAAWATGGAVVIDDVDYWAELAQYDSSGSVLFSMVSTAGTIASVSAVGLDAGDTVAFDDDDAQSFTDYARGFTGMAGEGTFTGVWSDPATPLFSTAGKTPGAGTIAVVAVSGTASAPSVIGDAYAYGQCYEISSFGKRGRR